MGDKFFECSGIDDSVAKLCIKLKPGTYFYQNGKSILKYYYGKGMEDKSIKEYYNALGYYDESWDSIKLYFKNEKGNWILKNMKSV